VVEHVLVFSGVWTLGYSTGAFLSAKVFQAIKAGEFSRAIHARASAGGATFQPQQTSNRKIQDPVEGSVIGSIAIPRLGLSTMVVEGGGDRDLKTAAGHIPGTSLPGEGGNVGIAGHRDTFFRPLRHIRKDDAIRVRTLDREYLYRVVSIEIVGPGDIQVLYPTKTETLTLVTCYPFDFVGPAPQRFIVRARPVGRPPER